MNFCNKLVFALGKIFQRSIIFVGKAESLPLSRVPKRWFTHVGSSLTANIRLGWKGLHRPNTSSLQKVIKFYNNWPQVAAWVPNMFNNFYSVKNHKIANNSKIEITTDMETLKFYAFCGAYLTNFINKQISFNNIDQTIKLTTGWKIPIVQQTKL